jgi:tricorn protease
MSIIKVVDCTTYKAHELTSPVRLDNCPCFDPEGKYLYFISNRDFKPVYDSQQFDLSFPQSTRIYAIPLLKETPSPFAPDEKPFIKKDSTAAAALDKSDGEKTGADRASEKTGKAPSRSSAARAGKQGGKDSAERSKQNEGGGWVGIDLEGIQDRILVFPFTEGLYTDLCAARGRVLFISFALKGISRDFSWFTDDSDPGSLVSFDFSEQKCAVLQTGLYAMRLGPDNQTLIYRTKERLRVIDGLQPSSKGPDGKSECGRATGFIDLERCKVLVDPRKEWAQMYREAWRLQREHFWDEKMSSVDWNLVYGRYARILPKLRTRGELSDVLWEMQGELGTSHAYEFGGDKPGPRPYYMGFLGCDLVYEPKQDAYRVSQILKGDSWDREGNSPLAEPGVNVEEGDLILAVDGRRVSRDLGVFELLLKSGGSHVQLTVKRGTRTRSVSVRTLTSERFLRYRHWVETNRKMVAAATKDKVGYIHIPDMGPFGYAEFHRSFLAEFHHDGLIIDARYNRGGHVSPLLLSKLMRKRIGYDVPRWGQPQPYPAESPAGPMVALTNQYAGSDGDIFSHCFKLYELGPLVGKRTWGGVIGIDPRHRLVDATLTTQPEYSFWFQDVGWSVENHGTDPDYEIDYRPQDYRDGRDPQLERAIALVLDALKRNPVRLPSFKSRPRLPLPVPARAAKKVKGERK